MVTWSDEAYVLTSYPFGEGHLVVVLLTAEHGIKRVVAHGARKSGGKLSGQMALFNRLSLTATSSPKRDLDVFRESTPLSHCAHIKSRPAAFAWLQVAAEFLMKLLRDSEPSPDDFQATSDLIAGFTRGWESVRRFQWQRWLSHGFVRQPDWCLVGHKIDLAEPVYATFREGFFACTRHHRPHEDQILAGGERWLLNPESEDPVSNNVKARLEWLFRVVEISQLGQELRSVSAARRLSRIQVGSNESTDTIR